MNLEKRLDKLTGWLGALAPLLTASQNPGQRVNPSAGRTLDGILNGIAAWESLNPVTDPAELAALKAVQTQTDAARAASLEKQKAALAAAVAADASPHVTPLTDDTFPAVLAKGRVAVKVWQDGCAPCVEYGATFAAAAAQNPAGVTFASYLLPRGPSAFRRAYQKTPGTTVPTTILFADGAEKARAAGKMDAAALAKFLAQ